MDTKELCQKIREIYSDIGVWGIDLAIEINQLKDSIDRMPLKDLQNDH